MTGLLVAVVMLLFVCVPSSAPWADTASGLQNRVAQADNSQIVPPDPEQPAEAPAASSAADAAAEVLRLRDLIGEKRDEIEAGRSAALEQVEKTYRANLAAIEPKDMFETELEYQQRDAREKSGAVLERAKSAGKVNRKHDTRLKLEVEPLVQQVGELLRRTDIVPTDAIDFDLGTYDAEHEVFVGSLKITSGIVQTNAWTYLSMRKEDARVLWRNKASFEGKIQVSMDIHSLDIEIEEFWLENPELGIRIEERIAVKKLLRPSATPGQSEEQPSIVAGLKTSAVALAKRAAQGIGDATGRDPKADGWLAEYNRLIGEAKLVFTKDPHVQALGTLSYMGSNIQASGAVTRAARGLEAYLTSFISHDAFRMSASLLAKRALEEVYWLYKPYITQGWIAEYNRLIGEAQAVFTKDPHIQGLKALVYGGDKDQAAGAVATAAAGLEAYLTSFVPHDAFRVSVSLLAERAAQGIGDATGRDPKADGWLAEYNRLIGEAKLVFTKDPHVQALGTLSYMGSNIQASGAVTRAARGLEAYLTSFISHDAFRMSASLLAKRALEEVYWLYKPYITQGWIAEYNRLIGEAQAVFTKDPHIQGLKALVYGGDKDQAAGAVATAAEKLGRITATIKEPPRKPEAGAVAKATAPGYTPLDYLPYSGRFSQDAHRLANLLGRAFSPDARDENGWTDLHYAAALNLPGLASALLDAGADPNAKLKRDGKAFSFRLKSTLSQFGLGVENWVRVGAAPLIYAAVVNAHLGGGASARAWRRGQCAKHVG